MILLLDNYDSFTYNLVDYFNQLNVEVKVMRNDEPLDGLIDLDIQGVVLSPGPEKPQSSGHLLKVAEHYFGKLPLLGICLGHQAIGVLQGSDLVKAEKPMHGKLSTIRAQEGILFRDLPDHFEVVRYHSLILKNIPKGYLATALTDQNEIMAIENEGLMACGIQFHPEAVLTQYGIEILRNWASFYNIV